MTNEIKKLNQALSEILPYLAERIQDGRPFSVPCSLAELRYQAIHEAIFALERKARKTQEFAKEMEGLDRKKSEGSSCWYDGIATILSGFVIEDHDSPPEEEDHDHDVIDLK